MAAISGGSESGVPVGSPAPSCMMPPMSSESPGKSDSASLNSPDISGDAKYIGSSTTSSSKISSGESGCHSECARVMMDARSNRNPSTCISSTQYLRQSTINLLATGWLQLNVLPHPE